MGGTLYRLVYELEEQGASILARLGPAAASALIEDLARSRWI